MEEDDADLVLGIDDFFSDDGSIISEDLSEGQDSDSGSCNSSSCLSSDLRMFYQTDRLKAKDTLQG